MNIFKNMVRFFIGIFQPRSKYILKDGTLYTLWNDVTIDGFIRSPKAHERVKRMREFTGSEISMGSN